MLYGSMVPRRNIPRSFNVRLKLTQRDNNSHQHRYFNTRASHREIQTHLSNPSHHTVLFHGFPNLIKGPVSYPTRATPAISHK